MFQDREDKFKSTNKLFLLKLLGSFQLFQIWWYTVSRFSLFKMLWLGQLRRRGKRRLAHMFQDREDKFKYSNKLFLLKLLGSFQLFQIWWYTVSRFSLFKMLWLGHLHRRGKRRLAHKTFLDWFGLIPELSSNFTWIGNFVLHCIHVGMLFRNNSKNVCTPKVIFD